MKKIFAVGVLLIFIFAFSAAAFAATTEENVITLYPADLENGTASGEGWSFDGSALTIESGYILVFEAGCDYKVYNNGTIKSGTFDKEVENGGTIEGGTFDEEVKNEGTIEGGNFEHQVVNKGIINDGNFSGDFSNQYEGTVSGGTFDCEFYNAAKINGGTFMARVENFVLIEGGIFNQNVINTGGGRITGGTFDGIVENFGVIASGTFSKKVKSEGTIEGGNFEHQVENTGMINDGNFSGEVANRDGGAINEGTFNCYVFNYGIIYDGTFTELVENFIRIDGGIFEGNVVNNSYINGGTFSGSVENKKTITSGDFFCNVKNEGTIEGGKFEQLVENTGIINEGSFKGEVNNEGTINDGTFFDAVTNINTINGGIFNGTVFNETSGSITGGEFKNEILGPGTVDIKEATWETSPGVWANGTFAEAVDGVCEGGTIKLLKDINYTGEDAIVFTRSTILDTHEKELELNKKDIGIRDNAKLTIKGGGTITSDNAAHTIINHSGTLEVIGTNIKCTGGDAIYCGSWTKLKISGKSVISGKSNAISLIAADSVVIEGDVELYVPNESEGEISTSVSTKILDFSKMKNIKGIRIYLRLGEGLNVVLPEGYELFDENGKAVLPQNAEKDSGYTADEKHTCFGGTATCTDKAACTTCGFEYGEADKNNHDHSGKLVADGTHHYRVCARTGCDEILDKEACSGGTATCTDKVVCATCGFEYGEADKNNHDHSGKLVADGTHHYRVCARTGCDEILDKEACSGGTATCTDKAVCTTCGFEHGELNPKNHGEHGTVVKGNFEETCTADGYTGDIHCKGCDEITVKGTVILAHGHNYGEWETVYKATEKYHGKQEKTCSVCGNKIFRFTKPLSENGITIITVEKEDDESNPNTGAPVFINPILGAAMIIFAAAKKRR